MAGVSARPRWQDRGPLGGLARAQYAALLRARWQMLTHSLRTPEGYWELGARGLGVIFYCMMGVGLSIGLGFLAYVLAARGEWSRMRLLFWTLLLIWQSVPIGLAWFQGHSDMGDLLRFPLSFGSYFLLHLVSGVADVSTLQGGLCALGIWIGVAVARPDRAAWALAAVLLFAAMNVALVRLTLVWLDRWLARRRSRELVGAALAALVLSVQLLNPALRKENTEHRVPRHWPVVEEPEGRGWPQGTARAAEAVDRWLPPGLAARVLAQPSGGEAGLALAELGVYGAMLMALLGLRLGAEFRGEDLSEVADSDAGGRAAESVPMRGAGPIAAVLQKELRTALRSMPVLYVIGAPLFMVLVLSSLLQTNATQGWARTATALPACLAYALMGVSQLIFNALGTEGAGVRLLFLSPTPMRAVMVGKNLFHGLAFALVAATAWVLTSVRVGWPNDVLTAATVAWLLFALPANLAIGNQFSLKMPHRMDPGRLMRRRGSASSALLTILVQFGFIAIAAVVFVGCARLGRLWMAVPVFLLLAALASYAWLRVYDGLDELAAANKERLIDTLTRME